MIATAGTQQAYEANTETSHTEKLSKGDKSDESRETSSSTSRSQHAADDGDNAQTIVSFAENDPANPYNWSIAILVPFYPGKTL